jgi:hypothetical protein
MSHALLVAAVMASGCTFISTLRRLLKSGAFAREVESEILASLVAQRAALASLNDAIASNHDAFQPQPGLAGPDQARRDLAIKARKKVQRERWMNDRRHLPRPFINAMQFRAMTAQPGAIRTDWIQSRPRPPKANNNSVESDPVTAA